MKLNPKKRKKCFVTASRLDDIYQILGPRNGDSTFKDAQFRFWAHATFQLLPGGTSPQDVRKRPTRSHRSRRGGSAQDEDLNHLSKLQQIVTAEEMYDRLTWAHQSTNHGGRDKTSGPARTGDNGVDIHG